MNLIDYKRNLLEEISQTLVIEFDNETSQYSLINDSTPGIFWLWNTKEEAIEEYLSALKDMILVSENIKNETLTVA